MKRAFLSNLRPASSLQTHPLQNRKGGHLRRVIATPALLLAGIASLLPVQRELNAQNVTTQQYSNARLGVQSNETQLTPATVSSGAFGKVFSLPVLGHVFAQPLYMQGIVTKDGATHNVLFVATEEEYVYAFDADGNNPAQGYLWRVSLLGAGETWVITSDVGSSNIKPAIGITSTPVIDANTNTLYVVAMSKKTGTTDFFSRIHALSLTDGSEKMNGPTVIQGSVPGKGDGGSTISFSARLGNQRPGLLLAPTPNGNSPASVFIAWASHGDLGAYHGWVISYNAADISQQTGIWASTPNGTKGGIWMPGGALSSDDAGNIFTGTGNGTFSANTNGGDYGDSTVDLAINGSTLAPAGYFTPGDQQHLHANDLDMGEGSVLMLPTQSGPIPHLAVDADKSGELYLINRDSMGGYTTPSNSNVQSWNIGYATHNSTAFFNNTLYLAGEAGPLSAWNFDPSQPRFSTSAASTSTATFGCSNCGGSGATPSISANGSDSGIVWVLDDSGQEAKPAILRGYDPTNLKNVFYDSSKESKDTAAIAVKFTIPMIANGRVYVGGVNAVTVYGLGNVVEGPTVSISANPTSIAPGGSSTLTVKATDANSVSVAGSDGTSFTLSNTGGTMSVSPTAQTTYTATAVGTTENATASVTVSIGTSGSGCAPTAPGLTICSPASGATVGSPVTFSAGALAKSGNIASIRVYVDNVSVLDVKNPSATKSFQMTGSVSVAAGKHKLTILGYETVGGANVQTTESFTVSAGSVSKH